MPQHPCVHCRRPVADACHLPETDSLHLPVGSLVTARATTGVCDVGEPGIVIDRSTASDRPSWMVLFASGRYDGFNPCEIHRLLQTEDRACPALATYRFRNVVALDRDIRNGVFRPAFPALAA